jgi:hypothetical protein
MALARQNGSSGGDRVGGVSLILGSLLLAVYALLFAVLLPLGSPYHVLVVNPSWRPLAFAALIAVLLLLGGFYAAYQRMKATTGAIGAIGFGFVQVAYIFQACRLTWELCIDPVIASHPDSVFLLRDMVIFSNPVVAAFRLVSLATIFVGTVLFSMTLYQSRVYPKAAAIFTGVGALVYGIGPMVSVLVAIAGIVTFAIGCCLIGMRHVGHRR